MREGGRPLLSLWSDKAGAVWEVELTSDRFQLAPRVRPGVRLAEAARTLGPASLEVSLEDGEEHVSFGDQRRVLAGWEGARCSYHLEPGPGTRVGLYHNPAHEGTSRYRPDAVIARIRISTP